MNYPISNFNDNKVTLDQELAERTVAYRDLTHMEMQHMVQKHRKFYWYFNHQPILLALLIIYEIMLFYWNFAYFKSINELYIVLVILPPFFFYTGYTKEKEYFRDINLPVVKTVGNLKTVEIKHRKGGITRYFEVEGVRFGTNNNEYSIIDQMFSQFGINQNHHPVRIEYSPSSNLIWEIKTRDANGWNTLYDRIPEKFENEPIRLIIPLDQKKPLEVSQHAH